MTELLPCPFCGHTPDSFGTDCGTKWGYVSCCCRGPEVRTGYRDEEFWREDAIEAWNTRAALAQPTVTCSECGRDLTPTSDSMPAVWCMECAERYAPALAQPREEFRRAWRLGYHAARAGLPSSTVEGDAQTARTTHAPDAAAIRRAALEEAASLCEMRAESAAKHGDVERAEEAERCAGLIRHLMREKVLIERVRAFRRRRDGEQEES